MVPRPYETGLEIPQKICARLKQELFLVGASVKGLGVCQVKGSAFKRHCVCRQKVFSSPLSDHLEEGEILCQLSQDNGVLFPLHEP